MTVRRGWVRKPNRVGGHSWVGGGALPGFFPREMRASMKKLLPGVNRRLVRHACGMLWCSYSYRTRRWAGGRQRGGGVREGGGTGFGKGKMKSRLQHLSDSYFRHIHKQTGDGKHLNLSSFFFQLRGGGGGERSGGWGGKAGESRRDRVTSPPSRCSMDRIGYLPAIRRTNALADFTLFVYSSPAIFFSTGEFKQRRPYTRVVAYGE